MASKGKSQPKKAPKKKNGYEMPQPVKLGDVLTDTQKNQWKAGVSIGIGGFGEIYSACKVGTTVKKVEDYPFVIKIEPKENGPLFVEMHFYMRNAQLESIENFKKQHKLKVLGMPQFIGSGSHDIQDIKHRFIVLPRFGKDIYKIFEEQKHKFPLHTVYRLGWQILNVLEYIHSNTYVHGDIKGSNVLLGFGKGGDEQTFLLDFGLACHYNTKEFKPDPKKMHNGTIEYTSRDAHLGVPTMRGDIEILAYNLVVWAGAKLPWVTKNLLTKPVEVQKAKEEFVKTYDKSLKSLFGSTAVPSTIVNVFKYLVAMNHDTKPDYPKLRGIFEAGIKEQGAKNAGKLEFTSAKTAPATKKDKATAGRPDFNEKFGESPVKPKAVQKPEPSNEPDKRSRGERKKYTEVDSDGEEVVAKKRATKKKPETPVKPSQKPAEDSEEEIVQRPAKKTQGKKRQVVESEEEENLDEIVEISPQKRSRKSPVEKSSKEKSRETPESSESPPPKKSKADERKKEKSSKSEEQLSGTSSIITMKSKSKSSKPKKTIHLNFNLDVSLNSDVVVVVNRKDKKKKSSDEAVPNSDENEPVNQNRAGFYNGKEAKSK